MVSRREFLGLASLSVAAVASYSAPIQTRTEDEPQEEVTGQESDEDGSGQEGVQQQEDDQTSAGDDSTAQVDPQESDDVKSVLEFGAVGDGDNDDTDPIQQAFDDANEGDTIYLPAGTYRISAHDDGPSALVLDGNQHPDNLTVEGDGEQTVLRIDGDHDDVHIVFTVHIGDGYEGLRIRNLTIDGNLTEQNGELAQQVGNCLVIRGATERAEGNIDIQVENALAKNANMNGFRIRAGGVSMENVSAVDNGRHGFALDSFGDGHVYDPPITVRNAYATGNGVENENGHGFNLSGGKAVLENAISEENYQGTKTTEEVIEATYRQVVLANNDGHGYIRPGSQSVTGRRSTVSFDQVLAIGNGSSGFRFGQDTDYEIGTVVARANGHRHENQNIRVRDNAAVTADELFSFDSGYGSGLSYGSDESSRVATYVHYNNAEEMRHNPDEGLDVEARYRVSPYVFASRNPRVFLQEGIPLTLTDPNNMDVPTPDTVGVSWD